MVHSVSKDGQNTEKFIPRSLKVGNRIMFVPFGSIVEVALPQYTYQDMGDPEPVFSSSDPEPVISSSDPEPVISSSSTISGPVEDNEVTLIEYGYRN